MLSVVRSMLALLVTLLAEVPGLRRASPKAELQEMNASVSLRWPDDYNTHRSARETFSSWRPHTFVPPQGYAMMGLGVKWAGTCSGKCNRDGPVLREMSVLSRRLEEGETGQSSVSTRASNWSSHNEIQCPGERFVTGLTLDTAGTCETKCNSDGPSIRRVGLICSAPATASSHGLYNTEKTLNFKNSHWRTGLKTECPTGTFVTNFKVQVSGTCHEYCNHDGPKIEAFVLTCTPGNLCLHPRARGYWTAVGYTNGAQSFTYTKGTTHTTGKEVQDGWEASVEHSIEASVTIGGEWLGGSATLTQTLTQSYAQSQSRLWSQSKAVNEGFEYEVSFPQPGGSVWQWVYELQDSCGQSGTKTPKLVITKGAYEPPCCPPGYAVDPAQQHGRCHSHENLCICSRQKCDQFR